MLHPGHAGDLAGQKKMPLFRRLNRKRQLTEGRLHEAIAAGATTLEALSRATKAGTGSSRTLRRLAIAFSRLPIQARNKCSAPPVGCGLHDTFVYAEAEGIGQMTARLEGEASYATGSTLYLTPREERIHKFDKDGRRLG